MSVATILLCSNDASLTAAAREVIESVHDCHIEVVWPSENLRDALPGTSLVLLHEHSGLGAGEVTRLVEQLLASCAAPIPILVLSDEYCPDTAHRLLQRGVTDYLSRPLDLRRLAYLTDTLTIRARYFAGEQSSEPRTYCVATGQGLDAFLCCSPQLGELMDPVRRVAAQDTTVLLSGETGTGKTRLARVIHELSPRKEEPFLVVNCGSLSTSLIESEMFGHVRGAFTGADRDRKGKLFEAGCGTLLLDEIDSLPVELQAKLLRVVDDRVFEPVGSNKPHVLRARLIIGTNRCLEREVTSGRFRQDLYFRLNVVEFHLPPLRRQPSAIRILALHFVKQLGSGRRVSGISAAALRALEAYDWPGNVRELRNTIERAVALGGGPNIELADLPGGISRPDSHRAAFASAGRNDTASTHNGSRTLAHTQREVEVQSITAALSKHRNNRSRAAVELGISRVTLYKKLHKYGLMGGT